MSLTFSEQAALTRLYADRIRRSAVAQVMGSPLLRWQFGAPVADELLLVPQELRTADPSFRDELRQGLFGLSGVVAQLGDGSVFDLKPPNENWATELHGFGWLRHLRGSREEDCRTLARSSVLDWIARFANRGAPEWRPEVVGRRLISWLSNADMLLDNVTPADYDSMASSLGAQLVHLAAHWIDAPPGYGRLLSLISISTGAHCIAGHDALAERMTPILMAELDKQVLADGGHISRNPNVVVELLLDLLPLRTCFVARHRPVPDRIEACVARLLGFLRFLRLGDGSVGRFNGMGATPFDSVATLLGYDAAPESPLTRAGNSCFAKLEAGRTIVLADYGAPPPLEFAGKASAGCLSFELSVGPHAVFVNGGAPGPTDQDWLAASRATASHNTLVIGARSSARLVRGALLERLVGGVPLKGPARTHGTVNPVTGGTVFDGHHDGYGGDFALLHQRSLTLEQDGRRLSGVERLTSDRTHATRLPRDVAYAVHFHLAPDVSCRLSDDPGLVTLTLPDRSHWYFRSEKATVSIEEGVHYADLVGPRRTQQIVLRGACFGDSTIRWWFSAMADVGAKSTD